MLQKNVVKPFYLLLAFLLFMQPIFLSQGNRVFAETRVSEFELPSIEEDPAEYQIEVNTVPNGELGIKLLSPDNNNGEWQFFDGSRWGRIDGEMQLAENGLFRFFPNKDWYGTTSVSYVELLEDGNYSLEEKKLSLSVTPINDEPYLSEVGGSSYLNLALSQYVTYPDLNIYTNSFTYESWVNVSQNQPWARFFDTSYGEDNFNIHFAFNSNTRKLAFEAIPQKGYRIADYVVTTAEELPLNEWVHVAAVYDHENKQASIYWNGDLKASGYMDLTNMANAKETNAGINRPHNYLGESTWAQFDGSFLGGIRDVRFWNKAKSEAEIEAQMNTLISNEHLVLNYKFDDPEAVIAEDTSGNNQHGSIIGASFVSKGFTKNTETLQDTPVEKEFELIDVDNDNDELTIVASSSNSTLVPNENIEIIDEGNNKKMIITPAEGQYGNTTVTAVVSDGILSYQSSFQLTVKQKMLHPSTTIFDKKTVNQEDIIITINRPEVTLDSLSNGDSLLEEGTDYTISNSTIILKKEYLASQPEGSSTITFIFNEDRQKENLNFEIVDTTQNSQVGLTEAIFDKKSSAQEDIIIPIDLKGNTLTSIKNGEATLTVGTDYTIENSKVVLKKEYLAKLQKGSSTLSFVFNEGEVQSLNLTVQDSTSNSSDGSSSKPQSSKEEIKVDVKTGDNSSVVSQTTVTRTKLSDGTVQDEVTLTEEKTKEAITNVKGSGQNTASIVIPDDKDEVGQVDVSITKEAAKSLSEENVNLEIYTDNVRIQVPESSLDDFEENLYFRVIPIKGEEQRQEVESRARVEAIVKEVARDKEVNVVSRPMTIETNLQSRPVTLILPLREVELPTNATEREAFLVDLVIFIEHSDGDKELLKPTVVQYKDGQLGLEFGITKFSTFTILNMEGWEDLVPDSNQGQTDEYEQDELKNLVHKPYISGYGDMFRPNMSITRAQMASMLSRNLEAIPSTVLYNDVKVTHWAYPLIMEAKGAGIMTGVNSTTFDPNGTVTRAQMAVIAYRWIENECKKDNSAFDSCPKMMNYSTATFSDVSSKHWAIEAISFVKEAKVMVGYEDNTFRPNEKLTRAQAVVVLNNLFKRGPLTGLVTPTFKDVPTTNWAFSHIEEAAKKHTINFDLNGNELLK
ncbi:hypothetical protein MTP04_03780 [Lysinibacillus sp. PLM2]|nr:hypothetical protein MTP04_03780 [Lysinibacillus sp. PLM2]